MPFEGEPFDMYEFEDEISALESKILSRKNWDNAHVFYGSSSLRLWTTLEKDLQELSPINLAFGGSSFAWCIYYFDRIFQLIPYMGHLVIYVGDNDIGKGVPPDKVLLKFHRLVKKVLDRYEDLPISFVTIKPSPERMPLLPQIKEANQLIRKALLDMDRGGMINVFDTMLDERGQARSELYLEDQLHLNGEGYRIWKGVFRKYFGI